MVAAANLPSVNSASSTYSEKTSMVMYDQLGASQTIDLYMTNTGGNSWEVTAYNHADASSSGGFPYSSGPLATQTLNFGSTGDLTSGSPLSIPVPGGADHVARSFRHDPARRLLLGGDLDGQRQRPGVGQLRHHRDRRNPVLPAVQWIDGRRLQIPLASVASPDNLQPVTGNAFSVNILSGQPSVGTAGTGELGTINSSELEQSTVDIATELTNMIVAQRGYEANSQVFKAGADLLAISSS